MSAVSYMSKNYPDLARRLYHCTVDRNGDDVKRLAQIAVDVTASSAGDPSLRELAQELRNEALRFAGIVGGDTLRHVVLQLELTS